VEATPPKEPDKPAAGSQPAADAPAPGPKTAEQEGIATHATPPHERIDGLRAWIAQVDRKLGIRTYAFAAASILALAAAAVAIVFALQLQEDSATKEDLDELRSQIGAVEESATEAAQDDLSTLNDRLDALEADVEALGDDQQTTSDELEVVQDDISELRSDISDLESSQSSGSSSDGDSGGTAAP
jgi:hypothetical protein